MVSGGGGDSLDLWLASVMKQQHRGAGHKRVELRSDGGGGEGEREFIIGETQKPHTHTHVKDTAGASKKVPLKEKNPISLLIGI